MSVGDYGCNAAVRRGHRAVARRGQPGGHRSRSLTWRSHMPGKTRTAARPVLDTIVREERRPRETRLRPLGALEKIFFLLDQHRSLNAAIVAEIDGPTTVAEWRAAL